MQSAPYHWRRYKELYNLKGSRCETCGNVFFPARDICPNCRREGKITPAEFSGKGSIYAHTVIRAPPKGFEYLAPYSVAIVQLDEGPRIISQIVDCDPEKVHIGMRVEACFRKLRDESPDGVIVYGFKFRPTDSSSKS
ncbi:MAG: Zn-ribbon domain-containing OB-fold protein [Candidatus Bathyarchaeia archaeon]